MNEELHQYVESLGLQLRVEIIVHALIDLGLINELKCMKPHCKYPDVPFMAADSKHRKKQLTLDHIIELRNGGTHRIQNITLAHGSCNYTAGFKRSDEQINRMIQAQQTRKEETRAKSLEMWQRPGHREKMKESMRRVALKRPKEPIICEICNHMCKSLHGLHVHRGLMHKR